MEVAKQRLNEMVDGKLILDNLGLTSLDWMIDHPKLDQIKIVSCEYNRLTSLPEWPSVQRVVCENNRLTSLPCWPVVIEVRCNDNQLTSLPCWPLVREVNCHCNQLTVLPEWPKVECICCFDNQLKFLPKWPTAKVVYCQNNQLTTLPKWPEVKLIACQNNQLEWLPCWCSLESVNFEGNPLPYTGRVYRIKLQACISLFEYLRRRAVIDKWKRFTRQSVAKKKEGVHLELKYSPDLPFIWHSLEAQHWMEQVIERGWLAHRAQVIR